MHVLLADVDPSSRRSLRTALESEGFQVSEAGSAIETIARVHEPVVSVDALVVVGDIPPIQGSVSVSHEHAFNVLNWMRMAFPAMLLFYVSSDAITPELEKRAHLFNIQLLHGRGAEIWACLVAHLAATPVPLPAPRRNVVRQEEAPPPPTN